MKIPIMIFAAALLAACPPPGTENPLNIDFYIINTSGEGQYIMYRDDSYLISPGERYFVEDPAPYSSVYFLNDAEAAKQGGGPADGTYFFILPIGDLAEHWQSNGGRFSDELMGIFTAYPVQFRQKYDEKNEEIRYEWTFSIKENWRFTEETDSLEAELFSLTPSLVYMAADNDLYTAALADINEMEAGWNASAPLYVFLDPPQNSPFSQPMIFRIVHDETEEIVSPVVKMYVEEIDSASKDGLMAVLSDLGRAFDKLILWSHSTGWLPGGIDYNRIPLNDAAGAAEEDGSATSRTFGVDGTADSQMAVNDLASVFENYFSVRTLIFDSCRMGTVEVFAEFAGAKVEQIIAPAADIETGGLYYTTLAAMPVRQDPDLGRIVKEYQEAGGGELSLVKARPKDFAAEWISSRVILHFDAGVRSAVKAMQSPEAGYAVVFYDFFDFLDKTNSMWSSPFREMFETAPEGASPGCYLPYTEAENPSEALKAVNGAFERTKWANLVSFGNGIAAVP